MPNSICGAVQSIYPEYKYSVVLILFALRQIRLRDKIASADGVPGTEPTIIYNRETS
jgi:hypothetical protein